jgi:hypothetical protein
MRCRMPGVMTFKIAIMATFGFLAWGFSASSISAKEPSKKPPRGIVIVVGGVGGIDVAGCSAQLVLPHKGIQHEVVDFYWSHGKGQIFKDLQDTRHALRKADELAWLVWSYRLFQPDRPIYLIGKSGGAGLVLAAVERLPRGMIERVILLSAAVSPAYDLRPALRAVKQEIVSFYSPCDRFVLGWGTSHFGTIDRFYGPSAGLLGFQVPKNLNSEDRALYDRLVQFPWHSGMIWQGHFGGHIANSLPIFMAREVVPWLKP